MLLGDNFYPSGVISENGKSWENIRKAKIKIPIFVQIAPIEVDKIFFFLLFIINLFKFIIFFIETLSPDL